MKDLKSLLQRSYIAGTSSITLRSFAYAQDDKRSSSLHRTLHNFVAFVKFSHVNFTQLKRI